MLSTVPGTQWVFNNCCYSPAPNGPVSPSQCQKRCLPRIPRRSGQSFPKGLGTETDLSAQAIHAPARFSLHLANPFQASLPCSQWEGDASSTGWDSCSVERLWKPPDFISGPTPHLGGKRSTGAAPTNAGQDKCGDILAKRTGSSTIWGP